MSSQKIDTLFLVGHGTENGEKCTIPFVLANIEVEKPGRRVEVVFIFNGVTLAIPGKAAGFNIGVPFESFDLETRMKDFQKKGGIISACTPCLIHRGLQDSPVLDGILRIKGTDLMEKKDLAARLMPFT
jgi:predicted peroxiredoxin